MDDKEKMAVLVSGYLLLIEPAGSSSGELYARAAEFNVTLHLHEVTLNLMTELELISVEHHWVRLTEKGREIVWEEAANLNRLVTERN